MAHENHRLIKDVSNALNYYFEKRRKEEAFDTSSVIRPGYDLNNYKFKKLFGYSTGYDNNLRRIIIPDLRKPRLPPPESEELKLREKFYRDELKYHLKLDKKKPLKAAQSANVGSSGKSFHPSLIKSETKAPRNTSNAKVPVGLLALRNKMTPNLSKREKFSFLNLTSKIMSASSELCLPRDDLIVMRNLAGGKRTAMPKIPYYQVKEPKGEKEFHYRRSVSSKGEEEFGAKSSNEQKEEKEMERRRLELLNQRENERQAKKDIEESEDMTRKLLRKMTMDSQKMKSDDEERRMSRDERDEIYLNDLPEIDRGELVNYKVIVKTGDRSGSSTDADIKLQIFGKKGKTRVFYLKDSMTHKNPFQRSNIDEFEISAFSVGPIKAISIGHSEQNIEHNWFMDYLRIEDHLNNLSYSFKCEDWFGKLADDHKSARILHTTEEAKVVYDTESEYSSRTRSLSSSTSRSNKSRSRSSSSSSKGDVKKKHARSRSSSSSRTSSSASSRKVASTNKVQAHSMRSPSSTSSSSLSSKRSSPLSKSSKSGSETRNPKIQSKNPSFTHIQAKNSTKMKMSAVEAVSHNQLDHLKELVRDSSIELKKTDPQGKTLMSIACENGYENITRFLAENDVSLVSIETPSGYYPVHYCARYNHLDCLKILFDYGASLSPKTNEGKTPLHLAAMWGHVDIVKWLVQQRVNIDIIDNDRMTACDLARKNDQTEIEDFLANCSTGRSSSRPTTGIPRIQKKDSDSDSEIAKERQLKKNSLKTQLRKKSTSDSDSDSDVAREKNVKTSSSSKLSNQKQSINKKDSDSDTDSADAKERNGKKSVQKSKDVSSSSLSSIGNKRKPSTKELKSKLASDSSSDDEKRDPPAQNVKSNAIKSSSKSSVEQTNSVNKTVPNKKSSKSSDSDSSLL